MPILRLTPVDARVGFWFSQTLQFDTVSSGGIMLLNSEVGPE
jgi:hypothetical protein